MKKRIEDFAKFGGKPEFLDPLHVAQLNLPPWERIEEVFRGIFARQYYANHGPLTRELDHRFAEFVGTKYAVCVTNGTVALTILAKALNLSGEVVVPAFTFPATVQAVQWAGLTPVLCDVDPTTHMITTETIKPCITSQTVAIVGVHLWGRPCTPEDLESFAADLGIVVFFDSCHAVGCSHDRRPIGGFGAAEAFSFHATKIINGGEGGCITTDDDDLAARLRTIRSFHPSETFGHVPMRMNGKMSEAQAGMALLGLELFHENVSANRRRYERYLNGIAGIRGLRMLDMESSNNTNNFQYIVVEVDNTACLPRDVFFDVLQSENVICRRHFRPGLHKRFPELLQGATNQSFLSTEKLAHSVIQLPNSQQMIEDDVDRICELVHDICKFSDDLPIEHSKRQ